MTRAEQLVAWAERQVGCPYIFGNTGQICTPKERLRVIASKPEYRDAITNNCPVLSGKLPTCSGCKWEGKPSYDCRGLTREAIRAVTGRPVMGAGATSQWNDASNWEIKGPISAMPDRPCMVFVQKGSTMSHTGIYIGNGQVIHASGHIAGVIKSPMPRSWTHYAIPVGLYEEGDQPMPDLLKRGSKGIGVKTMQTALLSLGFSLPKFGADGDFGAETEAAVKAFQVAHSLPVTGAWDAVSQAKLEALLQPEDEDEPGPDDTVEIPRAAWDAFLEAFERVLKAVG